MRMVWNSNFDVPQYNLFKTQITSFFYVLPLTSFTS